MHIKTNLDTMAFFEEVDRCRDEVLLHSAEGDVLNLKSELCRLIFSVIVTKEKLREKVWIVCTDAEDQDRMQRFMEE